MDKGEKMKKENSSYLLINVIAFVIFIIIITYTKDMYDYNIINNMTSKNTFLLFLMGFGFCRLLIQIYFFFKKFLKL